MVITMEITRKIPTMKYQVPRPDGTSIDTELTITPYFVSSIEELVKSNRMCVCIHHTLNDYRYQILGNKYDEQSEVDRYQYADSIHCGDCGGMFGRCYRTLGGIFSF